MLCDDVLTLLLLYSIKLIIENLRTLPKTPIEYQGWSDLIGTQELRNINQESLQSIEYKGCSNLIGHENIKDGHEKELNFYCLSIMSR